MGDYLKKRSINGFSIPWFGISWDNGTTTREYFQNLLFYLESKRILVNPKEMELKNQCIQSVLELKKVLTNLPMDVQFTEEEYNFLRVMIRACNAYLDTVNDEKIPHLIYKGNDKYWENLEFDKAMKEFRSVFRDTIKLIESKYDLHFNGIIPEKY